MAKKQEESDSKRTALPLLMLDIPEVAQSLRLSRAKVYRLIYSEG